MTTIRELYATYESQHVIYSFYRVDDKLCWVKVTNPETKEVLGVYTLGL